MTVDIRVPWARVLAEGAVIVASILFALAVDTAIETRRNQKQEIAELRGLLGEVEATRDRLLRRIEGDQLLLGATEALISVLDSASGNVVLVPDSIIRSQRRTTLFEPPLGRFESIIASGRLDLIRDDALRAQVADWPRRAMDPMEHGVRRRDFWMNDFVPYLRERHDLGDWMSSASSVEVQGSRDLLNLLHQRRFHDGVVLGSVRGLLRAADDLIASLREALEETP